MLENNSEELSLRRSMKALGGFCIVSVMLLKFKDICSFFS